MLRGSKTYNIAKRTYPHVQQTLDLIEFVSQTSIHSCTAFAHSTSAINK